MTKAIKLNYVSVERFLSDYAQLCKGRIFLPAKTPLPENTHVTLQIFIPVVEQAVILDGTVIKASVARSAASQRKSSGMLVGLSASPAAALKELRTVLSSDEDYRELLDLPRPNSAPCLPQKGQPAHSAPTEKPAPETGNAKRDALSMGWIRQAIEQEEAAREKEAAAYHAKKPTAEKKNLTEEEAARVKPAGQFIMDLTKAVLRSGYYAPDHPGSKGAKDGLYESFQNCLCGSAEIMITNQETREASAILITGILDEPVKVGLLVGAGMAQLFEPKLQEYINRKGLVSFAVKKNITPAHFEKFVHIMSDPQADRGNNAEIGSLLTNALVENGITEISAVFIDDLISLELNLPWRVEMAIQRLAKDLKVLPMFQNQSEDGLGNMKQQIIQDILRPLTHPDFLKDLLVNCYIIAEHVEHLNTEEIEKIIIDAFRLNLLLPTSRLIFDEYHRLEKMQAAHGNRSAIERRFAGLRRILKKVSQRLVQEDVPGVQAFLEELFFNRLLTFEELPADVQYLVNTEKMVKDVQANVRSYVNRVLQVRDKNEAVILLKLVRRIVPALIEQRNWRTLLFLSKAAAKVEKATHLYSKASGLPTFPLTFIFKGHSQDILAGYENGDAAARVMINEFALLLGKFGMDILLQILSQSEERTARLSALDALIKMGDLTRDWVLGVLDDPASKWYLKRNALMLLKQIAKSEAEINRARKLVGYGHPRVRDEALDVMISLMPGAAEGLVVDALHDSDDKVRWRAMNGLGELDHISDDSIRKLIDMVGAKAPQEKDEALRHNRKVAQLITALGAIKEIPNRRIVEDAILGIAEKSAGQKRGLIKRLKKTEASDQSAVLSAAVATLAKIGTATSEPFLEKLADGNSAVSETAEKAANNIKLRALEALSNTPPTNAVLPGV